MGTKLKILLCLNCAIFLWATAYAQVTLTPSEKDSLFKTIEAGKIDTEYAEACTKLIIYYTSRNPDSTIHFSQKLLHAGRSLKIPSYEADALLEIGQSYSVEGKLPEALRYFNQAQELAQKHNLPLQLASVYWYLGHLYSGIGNHKLALELRRKRFRIQQSLPNVNWVNAAAYLSQAFSRNDLPDSARFYLHLALSEIRNDSTKARPSNYSSIGEAYYRLNQFDSTVFYVGRALRIFSVTAPLSRAMALSSEVMANAYTKLGNMDSASAWTDRWLIAARASGYKRGEKDALELKAEMLKEKDPVQSLQYLKLSYAIEDSIQGAQVIEALNAIEAERLEGLDQLEKAELKTRQWMLGAGLLAVLLIALLLYRNMRKQRAANRMLAEQKLQVETTLDQLKATQVQLVHAEKMASLGELTAGIAHEIQNPLNFVNNFAEVNKELNEEGREALKRGDLGDTEEIFLTMLDNDQKILHHGKRADAIVKSMLQHSHSSTGVKESTDMNNMADEYLRLTYHGLRAKDKSFNCNIIFTPDPNLGKVNVVPQEMGRVLLNLINNAFYAVKERSALGNISYKPQVELSTLRSGDKVILSVKDNGNGIPENIRQKIFQPFFTTKPTGEGTGLGLSLSYDIVKAHGGEIKVESKEGEGTSFIIHLPPNSTV